MIHDTGSLDKYSTPHEARMDDSEPLVWYMRTGTGSVDTAQGWRDAGHDVRMSAELVPVRIGEDGYLMEYLTMKESEILRKLDGLTIDQHMAVASGDFDGYMVDIDPELVMELMTEAIATAPIGEWQWLQTCLIARDDMSIGSTVRECCNEALAAWEKDFHDLVGYVRDHEHERPYGSKWI